MDPLVPWKTAVAVPGETVLPAVNVTCCLAPAFSWNGCAGDVLTPEGRPLMLTVTAPLNEFSAVTETEAGELLAPCVTESCPGSIAKPKSGAAATDIVAPAE